MWIIGRTYEAMGGKQTVAYLSTNKLTLTSFKQNAHQFDEQKTADDFINKNRMQFFESYEYNGIEIVEKKKTGKTKKRKS